MQVECRWESRLEALQVEVEFCKRWSGLQCRLSLSGGQHQRSCCRLLAAAAAEHQPAHSTTFMSSFNDVITSKCWLVYWWTV